MKALLILPLLLAACGGLQDKDVSGKWTFAYGGATIPSRFITVQLDGNGSGTWSMPSEPPESGIVTGSIHGDKFHASIAGDPNGDVDSVTATVNDPGGKRAMIGRVTRGTTSEDFTGIASP